MTSDNTMDVVEAFIRNMYTDEQVHKIIRLENNADPEELIGRSTADARRMYILLRGQPSRYFKDGLGRAAPIHERGSLDIHVLVQSGDEGRAQAAVAVIDNIRTKLFNGADEDGDVDVEEIIEGPSGSRVRGKFWGLMIAVNFIVAG